MLKLESAEMLTKEQMKRVIGGEDGTVNCIYYYSDGSWDVDEITAGGGEEAQAYCDAECWSDPTCVNCACPG